MQHTGVQYTDIVKQLNKVETTDKGFLQTKQAIDHVNSWLITITPRKGQ